MTTVTPEVDSASPPAPAVVHTAGPCHLSYLVEEDLDRWSDHGDVPVVLHGQPPERRHRCA